MHSSGSDSRSKELEEGLRVFIRQHPSIMEYHYDFKYNLETWLDHASEEDLIEAVNTILFDIKENAKHSITRTRVLH